MAVESVVETDPSIPEVTPPFRARLVVPEFFIILVVESVNVGPSIGHDVSFDVVLGFVSSIFNDVPIVSSMDMSYFEYFPMCMVLFSACHNIHPHQMFFNIDDEPQSPYSDSKTLSSHLGSKVEPVDETIDFGTRN